MAGERAPNTGTYVAAAGTQGFGTLGKYQPFARLGSGGQADVYLAVARGPMRFNKLVVLKCLKSEVSEHPEIVTMFLDEARLAARLSHPNVVHTFEVGEEGGTYFIAMEYLDGQPLNRLMRVKNAASVITPAMWAYIISEALSGLHYAHELRDYDDTPLGIVHRDVSPHNLFVAYDGNVKVVDFGIAKALLNNARTETGVVKGKASYMAPEQAAGAKIDRRADLFAMGIVLWEALTGQRLFEGEPLAIMHRLVTEPVPRVSSVVPTIDAELDAIVARAVEKDRAQRYQTADEMREALDAYVRSTGKVIKRADIGRIVTATFHELREIVQSQVQAYMANLAAPPSEMRVKAFPLAMEGAPLPEIGHMGTPSHVEMRLRALTPVPLERRSSSMPAAPALPRARPAWWVMGGAIAALAAVAAWAWLRPSPAAPDASQIATPRMPTTAPPAQSGATIELSSEPPGAIVKWNERALGRTPLRMELPGGAQTLIVTKDGFEDEALAFDLREGAPTVQRAVTMRAAKTGSVATAQAPPAALTPAALTPAATTPATSTPGTSTGAPAQGAPPTSPKPHVPAITVPTSAAHAPAPAASAASSSSSSPAPTRKGTRPIDEENPFGR